MPIRSIESPPFPPPAHKLAKRGFVRPPYDRSGKPPDILRVEKPMKNPVLWYSFTQHASETTRNVTEQSGTFLNRQPHGKGQFRFSILCERAENLSEAPSSEKSGATRPPLPAENVIPRSTYSRGAVVNLVERPAVVTIARVPELPQ